MNWSRGILLVAINLAVALPPTIWLESTEAVFVREHDRYAAEHPTEASSDSTASSGEDFTFNPCGWIDAYPVQQQVIGLANMPAQVLGGWRELCSAHWTLSGVLHVTDVWASTDSNMAAHRKADIGFLLLVTVQWILVGGFPLRSSRRPWSEPGMFITICAALSVAVAFVRPLDDLARLFALFAVFAWFWWFGLLVWKSTRSARQWTARRLAANTI